MPTSHPEPEPTLFPLHEQLKLDNAITVTGSRECATRSFDELFATALGGFIGKQRVWLIGGAVGIDHLATEWLLNKSENIVAVVPFTVKDQPKAVQDTLGKVERCVELDYAKTKKAYLDRNAYMVERSGTVIAFWNGEKGGTWATVQYALKLRRQVHVYPI